MSAPTPGPAPILMSTYRRLAHVKESLAALARNPLAAQSTLYLTSDGPMPGHKEEVFAVRRYLEDLPGFADVRLMFFEQNRRMQVWEARREVSERHGRYIYIEEDCVTRPEFLRYMNACLTRYQDDPGVFAVSGFTPQLEPAMARPLRLLRVPTNNVWGFGTWEDRDRRIQPTLPVDEYHKLLHSARFRNKMYQSTGIPLLGMLQRVADGRLFAAYDVMARLEILRHDLVSIFSSVSLVENIGFDGSGEHCGDGTHYQVKPLEEAGIDWDSLSEERSPAIDRVFASADGGSFRNRARFWWKYLRGKYTVRI